MNELGWGSYANDHEDANGQFESNFEFADALETADRAIFFRYMVHAMAQERGLLATFMAKPFGHLTGNGGHFHMSLWDESGQRDLFDDPSDRNGLGLSTLGYHFLGGLKKHAKAYIAIAARTVNSYKRLTTATDRPTSGATWAPVYVSHGRNNHSQMLRCPGGHIEDRTVDGSCNPYLAAAAILAAGLDGVEHHIDPGPTNDDNLYTLTSRELKRRSRAPAAKPARRHAEPREGQGHPRGPREHRHRGLRRLLREDQAGGMDAVPRAGHAVGGQELPDAVLEQCPRGRWCVVDSHTPPPGIRCRLALPQEADPA